MGAKRTGSSRGAGNCRLWEGVDDLWAPGTIGVRGCLVRGRPTIGISPPGLAILHPVREFVTDERLMHPAGPAQAQPGAHRPAVAVGEERAA